jgi:pyruvate dehydrogenase E1 component alpha subunit
MALTRAFDDAMVAMWKSGRGLGGTFSERGHEAISVGVGMALGPDDVVAPMHRDLGTYLVRGMAPERIFGNLLGRATGVSQGRDANLHGMGDMSLGIIGFISHLPQGLPVTLGVAMSFRHRDESRAALTFVGDGGTASGTFHETLNMAAIWQAPVVFVVENNQYAYSTPLEQELALPEIVLQADSYGIPGHRIDGNDVEAVFETTRAAVEHARKGGGPTLIEAVTMRMLGHAIHDGAEYVPRELLEEWERRDPLALLRDRLTNEGSVRPSELDRIDDEVAQRIREAISDAEAAPFPDPSTLEEGVWA